jgi:hypothetical protein
MYYFDASVTKASKMMKAIKIPEANPEEKVDGRKFNKRSRSRMQKTMQRMTYRSANESRLRDTTSRRNKLFGLYAEDEISDEYKERMLGGTSAVSRRLERIIATNKREHPVAGDEDEESKVPKKRRVLKSKSSVERKPRAKSRSAVLKTGKSDISDSEKFLKEEELMDEEIKDNLGFRKFGDDLDDNDSDTIENHDYD